MGSSGRLQQAPKAPPRAGGSRRERARRRRAAYANQWIVLAVSVGLLVVIATAVLSAVVPPIEHVRFRRHG